MTRHTAATPPQTTSEPLERGSVACDRFLETMRYEVRRPVEALLAVATLLQRQALSEDAQAHVRTLIEQVQGLARTIDDAADLAAAETGALELSPSPTPLRELMDDIQEEWQARAAQTGIALLVSYDGEELSALIDNTRLRQVFENLIEHALKLTRHGGVEASLRARRGPEGLVIEGSVRDSGAGIAPERLARIFETPTGPERDMGVGLALSRRLIEVMHGDIRAESNVGAGSTVTFGLVAPEAQAVAEPEVRSDEQAAVRSAHVLVVDDNATNRMVAQALCEMFDCTSESAEDGVEALEAARTGRFDLILMDIKMPRMDGVQATLAIRELPGIRGQVPIIALTANADPDDARSYIASGMSSVVEKPIKAEALLMAMNACLPASGERAGDQSAAAAA